MPAICINPIDNLDAELLHKLNQQNQDVRLFISDKVGKELFLVKKQLVILMMILIFRLLAVGLIVEFS